MSRHRSGLAPPAILTQISVSSVKFLKPLYQTRKLLREALFTFGTFTAELRKSVRSAVTIIITFCRAANEVDDSALVKYVIFEKFRSDPEKYRC